MRIPGPTDLFRAAGQGYEAIEQAIALVPKAAELLTSATALIGRAEALLASTEQVVARVQGVSAKAESAVDRTTALLDGLEPAMTRLQPVLTTLADTTSADEVAAVVQIVDLLPQIATTLHTDVLPVLGTLDSVAPDLRQLLMMSTELNEMLALIPGMGRVRRRFEEQLAAEQAQVERAGGEQAQRASGVPAHADGAPAADAQTSGSTGVAPPAGV